MHRYPATISLSMTNEFPSGPWTGYYQHPTGQRGTQDLVLTFEDGRMSGAGADELGVFRIEGSYNEASHEADCSRVTLVGTASSTVDSERARSLESGGRGRSRAAGRGAFTFGQCRLGAVPPRTNGRLSR